MSEIAVLLRTIAREIGRDENVVQPLIDILENNFYESIDSIKDLTSSDYKEFNFPKRIADILLQKVADIIANGGSIPVAVQVASKPQNQQNAPSASNVTAVTNSKMEVEKEMKMQSPEDTARIVIRDNLDSLKNSIFSEQGQRDLFSFMKKVFSNIYANPSEPKFRKIKQSNSIYQQLFLPHRLAVETLLYCGFQMDQESVFLDDSRLNLSIISVAISEIERAESTVTSLGFDPYKAHTSANGVVSSNSLAAKEGFINYFDELNKLKAKRAALMSQPIADRKVRVFNIANTAQNIKNQDLLEEYEKEINDESLKQFQNDIKKMIQQLVNQTFMSRSKQEYQALLKEPLFTKCIIRVKFPKGVILEGVFNPYETMDVVVDFVRQNLEVPELNFFIFQTPPRVVIEKKYLKMTLLDLGCIPGANFHFGLHNPEDEKKEYFLHSKFGQV